MMTKRMQETLDSPEASHWLKSQIKALSERYPIDAMNEAAFLAELVREWCIGMLRRGE